VDSRAILSVVASRYLGYTGRCGRITRLPAHHATEAEPLRSYCRRFLLAITGEVDRQAQLAENEAVQMSAIFLRRSRILKSFCDRFQFKEPDSAKIKSEIISRRFPRLPLLE
jgi:hypothetical protein